MESCFLLATYTSHSLHHQFLWRAVCHHHLCDQCTEKHFRFHHSTRILRHHMQSTQHFCHSTCGFYDTQYAHPCVLFAERWRVLSFLYDCTNHKICACMQVVSIEPLRHIVHSLFFVPSSTTKPAHTFSALRLLQHCYCACHRI